MRCTPEQVHELTVQIRQGEEEAVVRLCDCFMPDIRFATRFSNWMQPDAIQEVCVILICEVAKKNKKIYQWVE